MFLARMLMVIVMALLTHGLFAATAPSYIYPVVTLQGQFRIQWTKRSDAVAYKVYSYWMPLSHRPSLGGGIPDYDRPRVLCGTTTNDYFIVFAQGYYMLNASDPYTFRVVGVDKNGDDLDPNAAPETIHYPSGGWYECDAEGDGERRYRLKGSQNITQGSTGKVVMEYGFGDSPQVWMETWNKAIVWELVSGADYATLEDVETTYVQGKQVLYSTRYGVTVRAKDNLTTQRTVELKGTVYGTSISATIKIRIRPAVTVSFWGDPYTSVTETQHNYVAGEPYSVLPAASRAGYSFVGWFTSSGESVNTSSIADVGITDLYARVAITEPWADGVYYDVVDGVEWHFGIFDGEAYLYGAYRDDEADWSLAIPGSLGGRPVVAIGECAFEYDDRIDAVTVPASVSEIGDAAFRGCSNLTNVSFATNHLEIDIAFNAFSGTPFNSKLFRLEVATESGAGLMGYSGFRGPLPENLVLPNDNDLPCIFIWAFSYESGLKEMTVPASIGYLDAYAFEGCENLETVRFKGPPPKGIEMSYLLNYATKVYYPERFENEWRQLVNDNLFAGYEESDYSIVWFDPGDLGRRTGGGQQRQAVKCGDGAIAPILQAEIGWKLLDWDAEFTDVTSNMTIRALYQAKLPDEPFENGEYALEVGDCTWHFEVDAGQADLIVEYGADWPAEVRIPETLGNCPVTSIGEYVFAWENGISFISIPKTVTAIDPSAFQACESLQKIEVDAENPAFCSVDGIVYSKDMNRLVVAPAARVFVVVPDGVAEIGDFAFFENKAVQSVQLPKGLSSFGDYAFALCQNLTNLTFEGDLPDFAGYYAFKPHWQGSSSLTMRYPLTNETWDPLPDSEYWEFSSRTFKYVGYAGEYVRISAQETGGQTLAVGPEWFDAYPTFEAKFGTDFANTLRTRSGKRDCANNELLVWQDFVAGTDPTDKEDVFTASVTMVGGKPVISYTPELSAEETAKRVYTTYGKKSLTDGSDWEVVEPGTEADYNFFKISVRMK